MSNKNFHLWRIGAIDISTGKDDQKIERVIHEIAKAKFQCVASKKYVILITIQWLLPTNRTMLRNNMSSAGLFMQLKGTTELVLPLLK